MTKDLQMIPTRVGQRITYGHFVGFNRIKNNCYAVVVSPKCTEYEHQLKTTHTHTPATHSVNNGLSNTLAMDSNEHPAAQYCSSVDNCDSYYLPAMNELELCYRNLKPNNNVNYIGPENYWYKPLHLATGTNQSSIPTGKPYTTIKPAQTIVTAFVEKSSEAFDSKTYYWSSTEVCSNSSFTLIHYFYNGRQCWDLKNAVYGVRAVCRICIV